MFSGVFTGGMLLLALVWIAYFAVHSLLAAVSVKDWVTRHWPGPSRYYRLAYNLSSTVLLIPLLIATELASTDWLWRWQGPWAWVSHGVTLLAIVGFLWSSRAYDMQAFMGLTPGNPQAPARFGLSPLHRFVRHPWYFLGLVWLWTRDMDAARLVAALVITGYLWLGSRLEEIKLEQELGTLYRDYQARVPGLLPRPWRFLSRREFDQQR
ncbi:MAG: isoprenylcysteine carboxylmethyltransferase family protein [Gammaproteobacteria bacterium]